MILATMHRAALALLGLALMAGSASAADELKVGDKAPDFKLQGSDGKTYQLSDFKGKQAVVLNWFPKAFTGGCTAQCKSLKAQSDLLKPLKVAYFTASVDKPEDNAKFAKSLDVDYPILSDPDKTAAKAYGVVSATRPVAQRWTFYIDKDGVIKAIDKNIKTAKAGEDVAAKVKELGLSG
jgi:thioredoxin-dependent peroxiredoxin